MEKIENRSVEQSSRVIESIRMLNEISILIQSDLKIEDKFKQTLGKVVNAIDCHSASIFLKNERKPYLVSITLGTDFYSF